MPAKTMFLCVPQNAYMRIAECHALRSRPVGKVPGGAVARPLVCQSCRLQARVDAMDLPTVLMAAFLNGCRPAAAASAEATA